MKNKYGLWTCKHCNSAYNWKDWCQCDRQTTLEEFMCN